jgi:glycosyltransferase involved in cell wall biosynthesis
MRITNTSNVPKIIEGIRIPAGGSIEVTEQLAARYTRFPHLVISDTIDDKVNENKLKILYVIYTTGVCGGNRIIFEHCNRLAALGNKVAVYSTLGLQNIDWFPLKVPQLNDPTEFIKDADAIVATAWQTADYVSKLDNPNKYYFVQMRESLFYEDNAVLMDKVEHTYKLPLRQFTISEWLKKFLEEEYTLKPVPIIPNGVNTNVFYPDSTMPRGDKFRVLIEGNEGNTAKNVKDAHEALKGLDVEVWGVSQDKSLPDKYHYDEFFWLPDQNKLRQIYSCCDVLLKTSKYEGRNCLLPDVFVETEAGPKHICEVTKEDKVLCVGGAYHAIDDVWSKNYKGTVIRIKTGEFSSQDIVVTPEHKIAIFDNANVWTEARKVKEGNCLIRPVVGCDDIELVEITSVTKEKYSGPVYDISVPDIHHFATPSGIVHNCSVVEAMACGTPVIATNSRGIDDLINGKTCLLVPYGDITAIRGAVNKLIKRPALRRKLRENGLEYVRNKTLQRAIRSLVEQTEEDWRAVVVINGCKDMEKEYEEFLAPYKFNPKITYIWSEQGGLPHALNLALPYCTGEYLTILEDDDTWDMDFLKVMSRFLKHRPDVGMVYCKQREVDDNGNPCPKFAVWSEWDRSRMMKVNWISYPQVMLRTHIIWEIGWFDEEMGGCSDWATWLTVSRHHKVEAIDEIHVTHYWHGDNLCLNGNHINEHNKKLWHKMRLGFYS